jgi:hypothetical protein
MQTKTPGGTKPTNSYVEPSSPEYHTIGTNRVGVCVLQTLGIMRLIFLLGIACLFFGIALLCSVTVPAINKIAGTGDASTVVALMVTVATTAFASPLSKESCSVLTAKLLKEGGRGITMHHFQNFFIQYLDQDSGQWLRCQVFIKH